MDNAEQPWERQVLEKIALEGITEQRRRRRWGIFFKLLTFAYLSLLLFLLFAWGGSAETISDGKHSALVQLQGVIQAKGDASAEQVITGLQRAFEDKRTQGVILLINSPGGSPVQAGMINDEIRRLRARHPSVPLYAVVEDVCASGSYYVAAAADKIFVDKASIVGSIGVLMGGFGFTGLMERLGIERRLLTAGENKGFLDPFSPVEPEHQAYAQTMLRDIHQQFIAVVRAGRGKRLKETPEIFSGLVWTGARSIEMGLADDFGSAESVARDVIKAEILRDFTVKQNLAEKFAKRLGGNVAEGVAEAVRRFTLR